MQSTLSNKKRSRHLYEIAMCQARDEKFFCVEYLSFSENNIRNMLLWKVVTQRIVLNIFCENDFKFEYFTDRVTICLGFPGTTLVYDY